MKIREEATEDELLDILNSELYKHAGLKKCSFISIQRSEPDGTGCNWSAEVRSRGVPHHVSAPIIGKIAAEAKTKYNLK
jgi:hypothetical protein